jgi:hypothetical protein
MSTKIRQKLCRFANVEAIIDRPPKPPYSPVIARRALPDVAIPSMMDEIATPVCALVRNDV